MDALITLEPSAYRREKLPAKASELRLAIFAPPLVKPFQPSLTLPYLAAQLRSLGISSTCHNLSSLFYIWLFRRIRLESMERYRSLSTAIAVLRDPTRFFDPVAYHAALECLESYVVSLAERDHLPYSLYPASRASAIADSDNYRASSGPCPAPFWSGSCKTTWASRSAWTPTTSSASPRPMRSSSLPPSSSAGC